MTKAVKSRHEPERILVFPVSWVAFLPIAVLIQTPLDIRILEKLDLSGPQKEWSNVVSRFKLQELTFKNRNVEELVKAASSGERQGIEKAARKLTQEYYGKLRKS